MENKHSKLKSLRNVMRFIYNPKKKTFLEKTCFSWLKLIFFYIVFFAVLCGMTAGMVIMASYYIERGGAPITERIDGPGLTHRPVIHFSTPILWYEWKKNDREPYKEYIKSIKKFLKPYEEENTTDFAICTGKVKNYKRPCFFNVSDLGPCAKPKYGYDDNSPCVYLKLNKIFNWKPECYDIENLPSAMPLKTRNIIQQAVQPDKEKHIYVSCQGNSAADDEHIGDIEYYPLGGFYADFFPFTKHHKKFLAPLVAVKFLNPQLGTVISVRCNAWAKNINQESRRAEFQIFVGFNDAS